MLFFFSFLILSKSDPTPEEFCSQYSNTDCGNCISHAKEANYSCGYCADDKTCVPGDETGPGSSKCESWHFENDDFCKKDSSLSFSTPVKIGIGCFVAVVSVVTFVYWAFIFPRIFKQ